MNAKKIVIILSFLLFFNLISLPALTYGRGYTPDSVEDLTAPEFKLSPKLYLWALTGNHTLGEGQFLFPFRGDEEKALYGVLLGDVVYHDGWLAGFGFGYRQVFVDHIYGAYFTLNDKQTSSDNRFWIGDLGIERLGSKWDFILNGYFPFGDKKKLKESGFASALDAFSTDNLIQFQGHNEYDYFIQRYEEVGNGISLTIGRTIPYTESAVKFYLTGYHFDVGDAGNIDGLEAKLTYDITKRTSFEFRDNYDNVHHNRILIGLRFAFGGIKGDEEQRMFGGISYRLLDPIQHIMTQNILGESEIVSP